MNLQDFVKLLRSRWALVLAVTVGGVLVALSYSLLTRPLYSAGTRLFVANNGGETLAETYVGNLALQQRVQSYAELLTGETLAQRTIGALGLDMNAVTLSARVAATVKPDTVLIDVNVLDESPIRARDIANTLSDQFVIMVRELETQSPETMPDARVIVEQRASIPDRPAVPRTKRNVAAGLFGALLLGTSLAVLRDRLDRTIKRKSMLEEITGVGLVGTIPLDKDCRIFETFEAKSLGIAESFRLLRTNLQFLSVDNPPRAIVISSSAPNEGKSTTAIDLAIALAEAQHSVVLVDGDMRRPSLARYLGLVESAGFSSVLRGGASLSEVLQRTGIQNLSVLAAGATPPNPSELLGSSAAKRVLTELREQFDYVIIDTPPLLAVTDAAILATHCDGVLLMSRFGRTKRDQAIHAVGALNDVGSKLLGAVLTMIPPTGDIKATDVAHSPVSWKDKPRAVKAHPSRYGQRDELDSVHPNLPLLALPTAIGLSNIFYPAGVAAVALICTWSLAVSNASARLRLSKATLILPAVGALVALRPNNPSGTSAIIVFYILACVAVLLTVTISYSRTSGIVSLFDGAGLLLVVAVGMQTLGITGMSQGPVLITMGNLFTGGERIAFPLAGTITMGPAVAAAYLAAFFPIKKAVGRHRIYRLMGGVAALYVLVQSDRRAALVAALLIVAMVVLMPRRFRQFAPWFAAIVLAQPFLFRIIGGGELGPKIQSVIRSIPLKRAGEDSSNTLGGRLEIWTRAVDFYQQRVDWFHQTFGYGTFGQAKSGASLTYREFFTNDPGAASKTTHNSLLQTLFDGGWVGAAGFLLVVFWAARVLSRRESSACLALLSMLTALALAGGTEALLAPGYVKATPWWILLAIVTIAFSTECMTAKPTTDGSSTVVDSRHQFREWTSEISQVGWSNKPPFSRSKTEHVDSPRRRMHDRSR